MDVLSSKKEIDKIVNQIVKGYKPEKVILFGSFANGNQKVDSDIDLAVIKKTKAGLADRLRKIAKVVKTWEALDVLVYTPQEWEDALEEDNYFIKEITKTGRIVYEKK